MGRTGQIPQAESDLNQMYLKYALSRSVYFKTEQVSASGDVTTEVFYGISCAVLAVLLLGIPASGFLRPFSPVVEKSCIFLDSAVLCVCGPERLRWPFLFALATAAPFFVCLVKGFFQSGLFSYSCVASRLRLRVRLGDSHLRGGKSTLAGVSILFLSTIVMMFMAGG